MTFEVLKVLSGDSVYVKRQVELYREVTLMVVHHGGKIGGAAKMLVRKGSSKQQKVRPGRLWLNIKPRDINISFA